MSHSIGFPMNPNKGDLRELSTCRSNTIKEGTNWSKDGPPFHDLIQDPLAITFNNESLDSQTEDAQLVIVPLREGTLKQLDQINIFDRFFNKRDPIPLPEITESWAPKESMEGRLILKVTKGTLWRHTKPFWASREQTGKISFRILHTKCLSLPGNLDFQTLRQTSGCCILLSDLEVQERHGISLINLFLELPYLPSHMAKCIFVPKGERILHAFKLIKSAIQGRQTTRIAPVRHNKIHTLAMPCPHFLKAKRHCYQTLSPTNMSSVGRGPTVAPSKRMALKTKINQGTIINSHSKIAHGRFKSSGSAKLFPLMNAFTKISYQAPRNILFLLSTNSLPEVSEIWHNELLTSIPFKDTCSTIVTIHPRGTVITTQQRGHQSIGLHDGAFLVEGHKVHPPMPPLKEKGGLHEAKEQLVHQRRTLVKMSLNFSNFVQILVSPWVSQIFFPARLQADKKQGNIGHFTSVMNEAQCLLMESTIPFLHNFRLSNMGMLLSNPFFVLFSI
ncbi:uncharacterized protein G2W53_017853 [Senna tora]|uniref:Uncharacterized protein n=1 Tax=Senna tora TaxID=362788 RepID=A0A834TS00_9FABA|nr:uncharacterized protein G2W53_017853 [Senna tora]